MVAIVRFRIRVHSLNLNSERKGLRSDVVVHTVGLNWLIHGSGYYLLVFLRCWIEACNTINEIALIACNNPWQRKKKEE